MSDVIENLETDDGMMPVEIFRASAGRLSPTVIFYMDGLGPRPILSAMARRLGDGGCNVLLPNLYYRNGPWKPLVAAEAFREGPSRQQMLSAMGALTLTAVASDTARLVAFAESELGAKDGNIGCVGYCMGGAHALTAAANHPAKVAAVAAFHSAQLVTDRPDSPHLRLPEVAASIYIGVAGIDPWLKPGETDRLKQALVASGIQHRLEIYEGVGHGFAIADTPAYNPAADTRHRESLSSLMRSCFHADT